MKIAISDQDLSPMLIDKILQLPVIGKWMRHRFFKFGTVGASGTVVNLAVLYINQEILLKNIYPLQTRLKLSLAGAIFLATMNNYFWNRLWTWRDRKGKTRYGFFIQMGQYFLACGFAISLQYFLTMLFSRITHYLVANIIGIILAAILAYIMNDIWTFAVKKVDLG